MSAERWAFFRGAASGVLIMAMNTDQWDKASIALAALGFTVLIMVGINRIIALHKQTYSALNSPIIHPESEA